MTTIDDAFARMVVRPDDEAALAVISARVHAAAVDTARAMRVDEEIGRDVAQSLLLKVFTLARAGALNLTQPSAWLNRAVRNGVISAVRKRRDVAWVDEDGQPIDLPGGDDVSVVSHPVARMTLAFERASAARPPQYREALALTWRRYWRTVHEGRTLDAVVREEDPRANVGSAQRSHDRMVDAILEHADPDDRRLFGRLFNLRVLSDGRRASRLGEGDS